MAGSSGAVITALSGRGVVADSATQDYRIVMPALPRGVSFLNTLFLHCDIAGRPYKIADFKTGLRDAGVLQDLKACGPYQMNHVWSVTFHSQASKFKLLQLKELQVKGKRCLVVDPNKAEIKLKLHWVPCEVPDDVVRKALEPFGKVEAVERESWHEEGFNGVESTTRKVHLILKDTTATDRIPHQLRISNANALVIVPGRAPMCLRCHRTGHVRRDCRVPRCDSCRRFGHLKEDCVQTYATITTATTEDLSSDLIMDQEEAEETTGDTKLADAAPEQQPTRKSTVQDGASMPSSVHPSKLPCRTDSETEVYTLDFTQDQPARDGTVKVAECGGDDDCDADGVAMEISECNTGKRPWKPVETDGNDDDTDLDSPDQKPAWQNPKTRKSRRQGKSRALASNRSRSSSQRLPFFCSKILRQI